MITSRISLDCEPIHDWPSFHSEFSRVLGFPDFYGRNMDAWIDCMTSLDVPEDGFSGIHCNRGTVLTLELANVKEFKERCPGQYDAIVNVLPLSIGGGLKPAARQFSH